MNPFCSSSLVVTVIGPDRKQAGILRRVGDKLRRRGLHVHRLRSLHDVPVGNFDILLIGCSDKKMDPLAKQIEHLWTQKWNRWYAERTSRPQKKKTQTSTAH